MSFRKFSVWFFLFSVSACYLKKFAGFAKRALVIKFFEWTFMRGWHQRTLRLKYGSFSFYFLRDVDGTPLGGVLDAVWRRCCEREFVMVNLSFFSKLFFGKNFDFFTYPHCVVEKLFLALLSKTSCGTRRKAFENYMKLSIISAQPKCVHRSYFSRQTRKLLQFELDKFFWRLFFDLSFQKKWTCKILIFTTFQPLLGRMLLCVQQDVEESLYSDIL